MRYKGPVVLDMCPECEPDVCSVKDRQLRREQWFTTDVTLTGHNETTVGRQSQGRPMWSAVERYSSGTILRVGGLTWQPCFVELEMRINGICT